MNILAFEAANFSLSVALSINNQVKEVEIFTNIYNQDTQLFSIFENILNKYDLELKQLDYIITVKGPGSFTGIRMALAACEGIALVLNIPILYVSAFEWYKYVGSKYIKDINLKNILIILESRRAESYCQYICQNQEIYNFEANSSNLNNFIKIQSIDFCYGNACDKYINWFETTTSVISENLRADSLCDFAKKHLISNVTEYNNCIPIY